MLMGEITSAHRNDLSLAEKIRQKRLQILQNINHSEISARSQNFLKELFWQTVRN